MAELKNARSTFYTWDEFNEDLLSRMFDNHSVLDGYKMSFGIGRSDDRPLTELVEAYREDVDYYLRKLDSIRNRLEIIEVSPSIIQQPARPSQQRTLSKKVFVVHGHDDGMRETVARFIEKLGLSPIILSEQPNAGKTIIEKFGNYSGAQATGKG